MKKGQRWHACVLMTHSKSMGTIAEEISAIKRKLASFKIVIIWSMWSFYPSILNVNHAECIMCWENVATSKFHHFS